MSFGWNASSSATNETCRIIFNAIQMTARTPRTGDGLDERADGISVAAALLDDLLSEELVLALNIPPHPLLLSMVRQNDQGAGIARLDRGYVD